MRAETDEQLMEPYRVVRHLVGADEAPWPSALVMLPSGEQRLLVDAALLPVDWAGWTARSDGHVLAPMDVVRREDGHGVLIPVVPRTIAGFLARRRGGRVPPSAGEAVTLAVSILRGFCEASAADAGAPASWWLTDAGRPIVAVGAGHDDLRAATRSLVEDLAADDRHRSLWDALRSVLDGELGPRDAVFAEERMFAYAAAEPLADAPLASGASTALTEPLTLARLRAGDAVDTEARSRSLPERLLRHVDADVGDLVSRASTGVWRRWRERPRAMRPWMLATGAAAIVVAAGVLWPTDAASPPTAAEEGAAGTAGAESTAVESTVAESKAGAADDTAPAGEGVPPQAGSPSAAEGGAGDVVALAARVLDGRIACDGDPRCLAEVMVEPGMSVPEGAVDAAADERELEIVDEYGGVAVIRVRAPGSAPQFVVIERRDDSWLLRDVFAAQQP